MVERQLRRRGITEPDILDAFLRVPREAFVSDEYRASRLRRPPAADRGRADDLTALHRRADDPGRGDQAGRQGARGRGGLGLRGGDHQPDR